MRANHAPASARLEARIAKLGQRVEDGWFRKHGNPYLFCRGCGVSAPQESVSGHRKRCWIQGIEAEIAHYRGLLAAALFREQAQRDLRDAVRVARRAGAASFPDGPSTPARDPVMVDLVRLIWVGREERKAIEGAWYDGWRDARWAAEAGQ